jgi:hypothetical protein
MAFGADGSHASDTKTPLSQGLALDAGVMVETGNVAGGDFVSRRVVHGCRFPLPEIVPGKIYNSM